VVPQPGLFQPTRSSHRLHSSRFHPYSYSLLLFSCNDFICQELEQTLVLYKLFRVGYAKLINIATGRKNSLLLLFDLIREGKGIMDEHEDIAIEIVEIV
jgi:hypothetical protein